MADVADENGAVLAVDNTFATPYFQRPLDLGGDVVVHSTTKYLNGDSDSLGGAVVTDDDAIAEGVRHLQEYTLGNPLSPVDSYFVHRGTKTLPVRMDRHEANAQRVAAFLADHPAVETVYYPGLDSHPQHDLASTQMSGYGGVASFELDGDGAETKPFVEALDLFTVAVSLGGVESLVEHPATMSPSYLSPAERERAGISDSLVRAPIGVEDVDDLVADLWGALAHVS